MTYSQPPHYSFGDSGDSQPQQTSGVPDYSPQPMGPPMHQPMHQTQPMGPPPIGPPPVAPQPQGKSSPLVPVLAIISTLFLVGTALFGILWFQANGKVEEAETLAEERAAEIEGVESDLTAAEERSGELEGQVSELEGEMESLESQITDIEAMQECVDALEAFYDTEPGSDEETEAGEALTLACYNWVI